MANTNKVYGLKGRFIVEDWETSETIVEFQTNEEREAWLEANVTDGYTKDGIRVSIYEII